MKKLSMLTNQKAKLKPLWMSTSKKVAHTEAARALGLNHLTNAPDLKTDRDTVGGTTGIEVMMTVEGTGGVAVVVAPTSDLEDGLIMAMEGEEEVDIVEDVGEDIMTEGIIVVEGEVLFDLTFASFLTYYGIPSMSLISQPLG